MKYKLLLATILLATQTFVLADERLTLPSPALENQTGLVQALQNRTSSRTMAPDAMSPQDLSNILYFALGVKPDGHLTIPTAWNKRDTRAYLVLPEAAFVYDASKHSLVKVSSKDLRPLVAGFQDFVKKAPAAIVFTGRDLFEGKASGEGLMNFHAGAATQNVLLFCSARGLSCVPRITMEKPALAKELGLKTGETLISNVVFGYPVKKPDSATSASKGQKTK